MTVQRDTKAEIRLLEERLANPGPEENAGTLGRLIAEDFREIGSSGRMFDAQTVLGALGTVATRVDAEGLEATEVPDTLVAVTEKA